MAVPAPKIKAFLASVKETYLDAADDAVVSSKSLFLCVLQLELLHRGVLESSTGDETAIINCIQASAGKSLVDSLPKPLLAGLSVITGRVMEKLAISLPDDSLPTSFVNSGAVLRRCKEVEDQRFQILLTTVDKSSMYRIAEGYFLRATTFQPDAPPAWKKSWEAVAAHSSEVSWQATTAVSNLIRIATAKDNAKRASELKLVLCDCYLDGINEPSSNVDASDVIGRTFIAPHRPIQPLPWKDAFKKADEALKSITDVNQLSSDDQIYKSLLELRVLTSKQTIEIEEDALATYEKRKNRAGDKKQGVNLVECRALARKRALLVDTSAIQAAGVALCNSLAHDATTKHSDAVYKLLTVHVAWLRDVAQAKGSWMDVSEFVGLFLKFMQDNLGDDSAGEEEQAILVLKQRFVGEESRISEAEIDCIESVCTAAASLEWMCCGKRSELVHPIVLLSLARNLLVLREHQRSAEKERKKQQSKSIGSSESPEDALIARLEAAAASLRAILVLHQSEGYEKNELYTLSNAAVARSKINVDLAGEFGFPYYEFLCCWSGLHRVPWAFCSQPEARTLVKRTRQCLDAAYSEWGRSKASIEDLLLVLGGADAEGAPFEGGLYQAAQRGYRDAMSAAEAIGGVASDLIIARCLSGIAGLSMKSLYQTEEALDEPERLVRKSVERLRAIDFGSSEPISLWRSSQFSDLAIKFQIASSTQTLARILLKNKKPDEAKAVLEDAVSAAPLDPSASFALGSLLLYNALFGDDTTAEKDRAAQVQLLRAAKLDSSRADPFALLGYWYEGKEDFKRAIGCYSKSLLLDPSQPVAGRGIIRLAPEDSLQKVLDNAVTSSSALIGWAWRALALQKALVEGEDDFGVIALLKAVRCRDIERPENELLAPFFSDPRCPVLPSRIGLAETYFDLGSCYRRLGRYTAAIRSFQVAIEIAGESVPSSFLCSCAQVELELGLLEDAESRFKQAVSLGDDNVDLAIYGRSCSLLQMARRCHQDGKEGLAFSLLKDGVEDCSTRVQKREMCFQKLLGDLYTFGASLPPDVFGCEAPSNIEAQLSFVAKGEDAYRLGREFVDGDGDEHNLIRASLLSDAGSNLFLRSKLLSRTENAGLSRALSAEAAQLCNKAATDFRSALEISNTFSPAWCGLGCSVLQSDPLLAQHAFARALELESQSPDPYANLSFLYTSKKKFEVSTKVSNALTEVADTPMMWINRALILEDEESGESDLHMASDAYRAALQVVRDPFATIGVSITCRATADAKSGDSIAASYLHSTEYLSMVGKSDLPARIVNGIQELEYGQVTSSEHSNSLIADGRTQARKALEQLESALNDHIAWNSDVIRAALKASPILMAKEGKKWGLDRQIVHDPSRGELWLEYAKSLLPSTNSALIAAQRASNILNRDLVQTPVSAKHLSESLSLRFWLQSIENPQFADTVDLQRALLMNPSNPIVQEAIHSSTNG